MPAPAQPPQPQPIVPAGAVQSPLSRALSGPNGAVTPGGPQTYAPPTTISGTAAQAGLAANPATPSAAASLGASPDAAKMAGTPAALAGALGLGGGAPAAAPGMGGAAGADGAAPASLAAAERTGAFKKASDDESRVADQERLQKEFGSVGLRVESLVAGAVQQAQTPGSQAAYSVPPNFSQMPQFAGKDPAAVSAAQSALTALAADPNNQALYVAAQQALNTAGVSASTNGGADTIFGDPTTGAGGLLTASSGAQQAAAGIEHTMTLTPATMQSIGLTAQDLTDLGLDPAKASTYTIAQLRDAMAGASSKAGVVGNEAAIAASGQAGYGASRALNRDVEAAQGQAGYSSEAATQQTFQGALQGETIDIGGSSYKVEDLLNSDNFTQLATAYLQAAPGSDLRKQLDSQMPSLGQYIQANQSALTSAIGKISSAASGTQSAEASNLSTVQQLAATTGMTVDQVRQQYGDLAAGLGDQFTTTKADTSKSGILTALLDPSKLGGTDANGNPVPGDPKVLTTNLTALKTSDPAAYAAVDKMSPAQLAAIGVGAPAASPNATKFTDLQATAQLAQKQQTMTPAQLAQSLFGTTDVQGIPAALKAQIALTADPAAAAKLQSMVTALGSPVTADGLRKLTASGDFTQMLTAVANGKDPGDETPASLGFVAPTAGSLTNEIMNVTAGSASGLTPTSAANIRVRTDPANPAQGVDSIELAAAIPQLSKGNPEIAAALQQKVNLAGVAFNGQTAAGIAKLDPSTSPPNVRGLAQFLSSSDPKADPSAIQIQDPDAATKAEAAIQALRQVALDPHAYAPNVNWKIGVIQQQLDAFNQKNSGSTPELAANNKSPNTTWNPMSTDILGWEAAAIKANPQQGGLGQALNKYAASTKGDQQSFLKVNAPKVI